MTTPKKFFGTNRNELLTAASEAERVQIGEAIDIPARRLDYGITVPIVPPLLGFVLSESWIVQTFDDDGHLTEIVVESGTKPVGARARLFGVQISTDLGTGYISSESQWPTSEPVRSWDYAMETVAAQWMAFATHVREWMAANPEPNVDNSEVVAQIKEAQRLVGLLMDEWRKVRVWKSRGGKK